MHNLSTPNDFRAVFNQIAQRNNYALLVSEPFGDFSADSYQSIAFVLNFELRNNNDPPTLTLRLTSRNSLAESHVSFAADPSQTPKEHERAAERSVVYEWNDTVKGWKFRYGNWLQGDSKVLSHEDLGHLCCEVMGK
jgi:hypothetical protein